MKRYTFGLLTGLLVGFLGVLAYKQNSSPSLAGGAEAPEARAGQRRGRRPSLTSSSETRLEVARLDLRSLLADAPPEAAYERHLEFLKRAIFDRDWDRVRVAAEGLEGLRQSRRAKTSTAAAVPSSESSPIVIRHRLAARAFWKERESHRNAATQARALEAPDAALAELQKVLQDPEALPMVRQDAALWLGKSCGPAGLAVLSELAIGARTTRQRRRALEAIGRSGQREARETLAAMSAPEQDPELQRLAIEALPLIEDVAAGRGGAEPIIAALNRERPPRLRRAALAAAARIDWGRGASLRQAVLALLKSEREPLELRLEAIEAGRSSARASMTTSPALRRSLEALVTTERDGPLRDAALAALGEIGNAQSLQVIEDAAPTAALPATRQAFVKAQGALGQKFRGS